MKIFSLFFLFLIAKAAEHPEKSPSEIERVLDLINDTESMTVSEGLSLSCLLIDELSQDCAEAFLRRVWEIQDRNFLLKILLLMADRDRMMDILGQAKNRHLFELEDQILNEYNYLYGFKIRPNGYNFYRFVRCKIFGPREFIKWLERGFSQASYFESVMFIKQHIRLFVEYLGNELLEDLAKKPTETVVKFIKTLGNNSIWNILDRYCFIGELLVIEKYYPNLALADSMSYTIFFEGVDHFQGRPICDQFVKKALGILFVKRFREIIAWAKQQKRELSSVEERIFTDNKKVIKGLPLEYILIEGMFNDEEHDLEILCIGDMALDVVNRYLSRGEIDHVWCYKTIFAKTFEYISSSGQRQEVRKMTSLHRALHTWKEIKQFCGWFRENAKSTVPNVGNAPLDHSMMELKGLIDSFQKDYGGGLYFLLVEELLESPEDKLMMMVLHHYASIDGQFFQALEKYLRMREYEFTKDLKMEEMRYIYKYAKDAYDEIRIKDPDIDASCLDSAMEIPHMLKEAIQATELMPEEETVD